MAGKEVTQSQWKKRKGGFRASMFIFVLSSLDNMGSVANMVSLVLYFYGVMHFDLSSSANTLTNFMGSSYLLSLVGGFISDTYLNRLTTCLIFGFLEVLALVLVTIQAASNNLHPDACGKSSCVKGGIAAMFYTSLCLLALGTGGVRGCMTAFGADQFDEKDPVEAKALASFFNFLLLSSTVGAIVGVTGVVWVSTQRAWHWGFFIITVASFVGFVTLALGKPFYRIKTPGDSPILSIVQVFVVAFKNRKLPLPDPHQQLYEISDKDDTVEKIAHTNQMRFLDKAAILQEDSKSQPWKVCTVTQVEEVKILTRMLPIFGSTIIMNTCLAQLQTFSVQQGNVMNLKLGSFTVPAPSIPVIPLLFISILVPIYEFCFVPFARKITHHPSGITQLQRVGVGLALSAISMAVAGVIEVKRRDQGRRDPLKPISLFWLSFQYALFGVADMFTLVGLLEFYYRESPSSMKSLSTSFTWLSTSLGYFLSTVFVNVINAVTKKITPSKQGWLHGFDLNQNNLNLFYWFLAILSCLNFFNYLYWASWYKYKSEEPNSKALSKVDSTQERDTENLRLMEAAKIGEGPSSSDEREGGAGK
ncbi:protein NRT1/ PTR FAMILY 4.5-like [Neltuma alba]|uniref:protein NRT1/ PTR FAMILY 4.5-like n=1 Tax=Neltuma alba TaxID=207710 RepID=UPI0010A354C5|nr:protein NRT1/ PTR FAMILY 4.5-like [Prosopis alba]XP_028779406.1 protein NRT1/ PTR FAMILY 4.5-like [Prosopis alba]XP_028779407.1 protein NRT1/ PTR FAMILY 4.5-like [Prosopis alba]